MEGQGYDPGYQGSYDPAYQWQQAPQAQPYPQSPYSQQNSQPMVQSYQSGGAVQAIRIEPQAQAMPYAVPILVSSQKQGGEKDKWRKSEFATYCDSWGCPTWDFADQRLMPGGCCCGCNCVCERTAQMSALAGRVQADRYLDSGQKALLVRYAERKGSRCLGNNRGCELFIPGCIILVLMIIEIVVFGMLVYIFVIWLAVILTLLILSLVTCIYHGNWLSETKILEDNYRRSIMQRNPG
jgi:hypothetical protein